LVTDQTVRFRWVACQLDVLGKRRTSADIEAALRSLPRTLYETYDKILLNIPEEDRQSALKILQWLAFSVRAISLAETVEILATNPHPTDACLFNPAERLLNPQEVLTICSSLVTITEDKNTGGYLPSTNREEVRLPHFSVKEYLISEHVRGGCASVFYFNQHLANSLIAETCLAYLLQFDKPFHGQDIRCRHILLNYPLSEYAAEHWVRHARSARSCSSDTLQKLIMTLLNTKHAMYANWLKLHDPDDPWKIWSHNGRKGGSLYYTSITGLEIPSQLLLEQGADINTVGGHHGTAFQVAALEGYMEIVWLLLEHGADINAVGGHYGTALQAAVVGDHTDIVQLMIEHGADINAVGGYYGTVLQAAVSTGNTDIVQLLFEQGANINAVEGDYGTGLQVAASRGNTDIVRLLLEQGVRTWYDPNFDGFPFWE
jgi:Ankyrin repeats (3 copies)